MTSGTIGSVIIASAQSVATVFVIGAVGYFFVLFPRKAPFLPRKTIGTVARFSFHALLLPLVYGSLAKAVSVDTLGDYWFVLVGAFGVMGISYATATILKYLILSPNNQQSDFVALRVSAAFPNVVALPILLFPSLCEYPVVHEGYMMDQHAKGSSSSEDLEEQCVEQSTTLIFMYFLSYSICFWTVGHTQLMQAADGGSSADSSVSNDQNIPVDSVHQECTESSDGDNASSENKEIKLPTDTSAQHSIHLGGVEEGQCGNTDDTFPEEEEIAGSNDASKENSININDREQREDDDMKDEIVSTSSRKQHLATTNNNTNDTSPTTRMKTHAAFAFPQHLATVLKHVITSPGFVAMFLGVVTGLIQPLKDALFEEGGALRFFGSSIESLGSAGAPMCTLVVAASLVPPTQTLPAFSCRRQRVDNDNTDDNDSSLIFDERPGLTDPNFGPYQRRRRQQPQESSRRRLSSWRQSLRTSSRRLLQAVPRSTPEMRRLMIWFVLARLVVAPAIVILLIWGIDCHTSWLESIPALDKLVLIVESSVPGALLVIVLLQSSSSVSPNASIDTAAAVAKVYLPSYLPSIVTIASWTTVGQYITLPDENGDIVCRQQR